MPDSTNPPYQPIVDHFDRPMNTPMESFDPDELPEGEARELYDQVMAEYYSHIPHYPAASAKEKSKFDLIARTKQAHQDDAEILNTDYRDMHPPEPRRPYRH